MCSERVSHFACRHKFYSLDNNNCSARKPKQLPRKCSEYKRIEIQYTHRCGCGSGSADDRVVTPPSSPRIGNRLPQRDDRRPGSMYLADGYYDTQQSQNNRQFLSHTAPGSLVSSYNVHETSMLMHASLSTGSAPRPLSLRDEAYSSQHELQRPSYASHNNGDDTDPESDFRKRGDRSQAPSPESLSGINSAPSFPTCLSASYPDQPTSSGSGSGSQSTSTNADFSFSPSQDLLPIYGVTSDGPSGTASSRLGTDVRYGL